VGAPSGAPFFRPPRVFSPRSLCPKGFPGLGRPPEGGRLCVWPDRPVGGDPLGRTPLHGLATCYPGAGDPPLVQRSQTAGPHTA
jgi:hypothetical protein